MSSFFPSGPPAPGYQPPRCYRHGDQLAGVVCQRCDRPICPQCMNQASVGFHCPECAKKGAQRVYRGTGALATRPLLTQVLIAVNVAVFLLGVAVTGPSALTGSSDLVIDGGLLTSGRLASGQLIGLVHGEWFRLVTSGFLHYGLVHLGFNMYALWILGTLLERAAGRLQFAAIYAVSLLAGALGALVASPDALTAGASGAIYGLMGAVLALGRSRGISIRESPVFGVLVLNLFITFAIPGISIGGHIGGLAGGFLAGLLLFELPGRLRAPTKPSSPAGTPTRSAGALALRRDPRVLVGFGLCALLGAACVTASLAVATAAG